MKRPSLIPAFHPGVAASMAWRGLRRSRGASLLAVAVLALGLAAPSTFFSLLVGAIRPLPVHEGHRIVRMDVVLPAQGGRPGIVRLSDLATLQQASGLESLGAFRGFQGTVVDPGRAAVRVSAAGLTAEVLPLLHTEPALGRIPGPDEAGSTLLLGHDVWMEAYEGDPDALGRTVELNGEARTIVGVMPEGFGFPFKQNSWVVLARDPADTEPVELVGRLAAGATEESAEVELAARWSQSDALRVAEERGGVLQVDSYTGSRGESGEAVAFIGLVLVALALLLIACANVANLLLVRATERVRALGIQSALGAGRAQIGAQLLLESLILATLGGLVGLVLTDLAVSAIERGLSAQHFGYYWMRMAVDGRVVAFAGVLVVGTALVAGTLPVLRVWKVDVQRVLKEEGSAAAVGGGGAWSRGFVTAQLALSCAALVAAGLSARSLGASRGLGDELNADEVLVASVELSSTRLGLEEVVTGVQRGLAQSSLVTGQAFALGAPALFEPRSRFVLDGEGLDGVSVMYNAFTPGYADLFDIEVRTGRGITEADARGGTPVAVVSESFARKFSPERDVLGRQIRLMSADSTQWRTVVGVVTDVRVGSGERVPLERVYLPLSQVETADVMLLVRGRGDGGDLALPVRGIIADVDPAMAPWSVRTLADTYDYLVRVPRAMGAMALGGGAAGLLVAAVGLYGLLAFRVRQRRRELGVHLALGADGRRLALQTLWFALRQVLPAVALGLAAAWLAAPILAVLLLGTEPRSVSTFAGVAVTFVTVSMVAAAVPAIRASRVHPAAVLRGD